LVNWLRQRARLPVPLGAALVLTLFVGGILAGTNALMPQATRLLDAVPRVTHNLERVLNRTALSQSSAIRKATVAAGELQKVANTAVGATPAPNAATPDTSSSEIDLRERLLAGGAAAMRGLGTLVVVIALIYFLLISSHAFKRKLVKISGHTLRQKKLTVQILDDIDQQMQLYLLIQLSTSALVGVATGIVFGAIGLENAAFWGAAAGVLHLVPYVGPGFIVIASAMFAYLQFDKLETVLLVSGSALAIAGVVGLGLVPWLTGRLARLNAVSTFIALLFWDWLWGIPGLLLGIPIMMALMAVCERVDQLVPVAELLSSDAPRKTRASAAA
ncbi:MAG TPA: AI-2E family transporter, partial [Nevskiaceae bacterium]|nr:AI-2E family transporter [Nevskiaceae bacterium]